MSYGCMYILRDAENIVELRRKLVLSAQANQCGICFEPTNNLLLEHSVILGPDDLIFEVCDRFTDDDASFLLCWDDYTINGLYPQKPLRQRLAILEIIAAICVPYSKMLEIYLGEDTPYLPDYSDYRLKCIDVAETLLKEYQSDPMAPFIPCVHLIIKE